MSVAETDGDTPLAVFINPWTIQGWRPFSVSIQPAVFMRKGRITAHGRCGGTTWPVEFVPVEQPASPEREEHDQRRDVGHHPHRPVLDEHVRHVVPRPVLLLVLGVELVHALHLAVGVVGGQDGQHVGDVDDLRRRLVVVAPADLERPRTSNGWGRCSTALRRPRSSSAGTCPRPRRARCPTNMAIGVERSSTTSEITAVRRNASTSRCLAQVPRRDTEHDERPR